MDLVADGWAARDEEPTHLPMVAHGTERVKYTHVGCRHRKGDTLFLKATFQAHPTSISTPHTIVKYIISES
jgi:hypothetical protein